MTLGFSTKWPDRMGELAGQPNYFIGKIWNGLVINELVTVAPVQYHSYKNEHWDKFKRFWDGANYVDDLQPKLHTMREDPHDRWRAGMDIHMVINNRTKDRFQFAPVIKCVSTQTIEILNMGRWASECPLSFVIEDDVDNVGYAVFVDGKLIDPVAVCVLAKNDGFPSIEAFFQYFNEDFKGKIIHWTDLKY